MTFEKEPVDTAVLRAELAVLKERAADLEHLAKVHGHQEVGHARTALSDLRDRLADAMGRLLESTTLSAVSQAFSLIDGQLAKAQRFLEQAKCQCDLNLDVTPQEIQALQDRVRDLQQLEVAEKRHPGKVIDLGVRRRQRAGDRNGPLRWPPGGDA